MVGVILCGVILAESAVLAYSWYTRQHDNDFTCVASLSQHYNNESYNVSLNYMVRGNSGVINMNGYSEEDPGGYLTVRSPLLSTARAT